MKFHADLYNFKDAILETFERSKFTNILNSFLAKSFDFIAFINFGNFMVNFE